MRSKFWLGTSILLYAAMVETEVYRVRNGEPSIKPKKKSTERYQRRLKTLCEQCESVFELGVAVVVNDDDEEEEEEEEEDDDDDGGGGSSDDDDDDDNFDYDNEI
ncbi:hypothetical protein DPMN_042652 [Dreissena polymorpha]|uniref:Uncharacterized protein n=1 Tax=Dreissena polymorpha TaxID=45954 RepID=A0A9D4D0W7_DREPO|nr:hypothetical protein DPMN_042652 [Dreissena polymorpha]